MTRPRGKRVSKKQVAFFSVARHHVKIDIEMSSEPSATPVFTTRTTPVQDPLLALDTPPKS